MNPNYHAYFIKAYARRRIALQIRRNSDDCIHGGRNTSNRLFAALASRRIAPQRHAYSQLMMAGDVCARAFQACSNGWSLSSPKRSRSLWGRKEEGPSVRSQCGLVWEIGIGLQWAPPGTASTGLGRTNSKPQASFLMRPTSVLNRHQSPESWPSRLFSFSFLLFPPRAGDDIIPANALPVVGRWRCSSVFNKSPQMVRCRAEGPSSTIAPGPRSFPTKQRIDH